MPRYSEQTIRPRDGGRLITVESDERPGAENYLVKTNWRRLNDEEIRREGTTSIATAAPAGILGMWEAQRPNGERALVCATASNIYKLVTGAWSSIGSGYTATWWHAESLDGYLILNNGTNLPVTYRVEDASVSPMHELREIGVAAAATMAVYNGFLLFADITEIIDSELDGVLSGSNPYGIVASDKIQRIRYKILWGDYGNPRNWAPVIAGTIQSASKNVVTLAWPSRAFAVGDKLAIIGAGPGGGTLGGQTETPDGVTVTNVDGDDITINVNADAALTYPLTVSVTRFADTSSFVGSSSIQDDSSAITRLKPLKNTLVVYRETGIFTGRYTGEYETPFVFTRAYSGPDVPAYPLCIEDVEGDYHVYPTRNRFYYFDNAGNPRVHKPLDDARTLFFSNTGTYPFAKYNPLTKEVWFCNSAGVLAFDTQWSTVSWIDESYSAACYARDVSNSTLWRWYLGKGTAAYRQTDDGWTRASGASNVPEISFGYSGLDEDMRQKDLRNYGLLVSSASPTQQVEVTLRGKDNITESAYTWLTTTLMTPLVNPYLETCYRHTYFQDRVRITSPSNAQFKLSGRVFRYLKRDTRGGTRRGGS